MPIQMERDGDGIVIIRAAGKLAKDDYSAFTAEFDRAVRRSGKLRVLFDITNFNGWEPDGIVEEVKFDVKHNSDISRLAVVGDSKWHHTLVAALKPFAFAETRYYQSSEGDQARLWLSEPTSFRTVS